MFARESDIKASCHTRQPALGHAAGAVSTMNAQIGSLHWSYLAGWHNRLFGSSAPDWADLPGEPAQEGAELVKANPLRRVYHLRRGELDVYAKVYRPISVLHRFKWLIKPSPAAVEFDRLRMAAARGVPVVRPLAWAQGRIGGKPAAILITQSLDPVQSLEELLSEPQTHDAEYLASCLDAAADAVAALHCCGIIHRDLHPGNILITSTNKKPQPSAYLTDLQHITVKQHAGYRSGDPSQPWRIRNLAGLLAAVRIRVTEQHLHRFVGRYLQALQPDHRYAGRELDKYVCRVQLLADDHDRKLAASRDRRAMRNSKYGREIKLTDGWSARVFLQCKRSLADSPASQHRFTPDNWQAALVEPAGLCRTGQLIPHDACSQLVSRELTVGSAQLDVMVQHFRLPEGIAGFFQALRSCPALALWRRCHGMVNRRVPTAWPLAALTRRRMLLWRESIFIAERNTQNPKTLTTWAESPCTAEQLAKREFSNILIVKPSSLGDVVRCLPILTALRWRYPDAQISWLIRPDLADMLSDNPQLDRIIRFDRQYYGGIGRNWRAAADFCRFVRDLHRRRFDLVLDLQGLFRSGFLSFCTGSGLRVGFAHAREGASLFYNHRITMPKQSEHVLRSYWRFADYLGVDQADMQLQLPVADAAKLAASKLLQEVHISADQEYAVLLIGGTASAKRWPIGRFARLADHLCERYHIPVVLLGSGPDEAELAGQMTRNTTAMVVNLVGRTDLRQLVAILAAARIVVGNDSGPLHVAGVLHVPVVGLYGPTDPEVVGPFGGRAEVVQAGAGIPHRRRYSRRAAHRMSNISVEEVLAVVDRKINVPLQK